MNQYSQYGGQGAGSANMNAQDWQGRTFLGTQHAVGEIVDWGEKFGFIQPNERITHPMAEIHQGKVFLHRNDIIEDELEDGPRHGRWARFLVYVDERGLGASQCKLLKRKPRDYFHIFALVPKSALGIILGQGGCNIKEMVVNSEGCKRMNAERIPGNNNFAYVEVVGDFVGVLNGCKTIASFMAEQHQSEITELTFAFEAAKSGMFLGKKGATLKRITGNNPAVAGKLQCDCIFMNGVQQSTFTLTGPLKDVEPVYIRCIEQLVFMRTGRKIDISSNFHPTYLVQFEAAQNAEMAETETKETPTETAAETETAVDTETPAQTENSEETETAAETVTAVETETSEQTETGEQTESSDLTETGEKTDQAEENNAVEVIDISCPPEEVATQKTEQMTEVMED